MDVVRLLTEAADLVPATAVTEAGGTVADAREYLEYNEWEVALDVLADLDEGWQPTPQWWDLLIEAADLMWLTGTATWCRWARWESIHGVIRAELWLLPPSEGGRTAAVPGNGVLRPLWDVGQRTAAGHPDLRVARMWVEYVPELAPGASSTIRLAPLVPSGWRGVQPGQPITMHEGVPVVGTGTVIEVRTPV
ncbi:hypothetical protein AB0G04_26810 [Actinoplanes sp. NPDC023801]|uniref:hypothetical protein n=1 Tax=Actinoplanes sp. NPDC023801 TaxID=3154595 RepID=UPI0034068AAB